MHRLATGPIAPDRRAPIRWLKPHMLNPRFGVIGVSLAAMLLAGCTGVPPGVTVVDGFKLDRYLGGWYEIARLDHSFERGLSRVSAHYSRRADGGIRVVNRGYDAASGTWKQAVGKAYFLGASDRGRLKVSFFGPFYSSYNIIALDNARPPAGHDARPYRWALVCGPDRSYLWILARTPHLDAATLGRLLARARALGFDTDRLIFVDQGGGAEGG